MCGEAMGLWGMEDGEGGGVWFGWGVGLFFKELAWRVWGCPWQVGMVVTFLGLCGMTIDSVMCKFGVESCCT